MNITKHVKVKGTQREKDRRWRYKSFHCNSCEARQKKR